MTDMVGAHRHPLYKEHPWRLARLQVASAAHTNVEVSGLAKWVPARHASIDGGSGVTVANYCRTTQMDHYHVRRASISMGPLRNPPDKVRKTLGKLLDTPGDSDTIRQFQKALEPYIAPRPKEGQNQTSLPASRYCNTTIRHGAAVQLGDHSRMNIHTHCVVEETSFQLAELLADDAQLVTAFVETLQQPEDASRSSSFLRRALETAGRSDDLDILSNISKDIGEPSTSHTSIWALFGLVRVDHASTVMLGVGNTLTSSFDVACPKFKAGTLLADLDDLRDTVEELDPPPPRAVAVEPTVRRTPKRRPGFQYGNPDSVLTTTTHSRSPSYVDSQPDVRNPRGGLRGPGF